MFGTLKKCIDVAYRLVPTVHSIEFSLVGTFMVFQYTKYMLYVPTGIVVYV